jgi:hypothetical protein
MALSVFANARKAVDYAFGVTPNGPPGLRIFSGGSTTSGTFSITLDYGYIVALDGSSVALTAKMPINLGVSTTNETITPTTVSNPTPYILGTCVITATFSHAHGVGELITSGDGGLSVAATAAAGPGAGLVIVDAAWGSLVGATLSHAGMNTAITGYNSVSANVTLLDWSGFTGALSYNAASGSAYASTTHVLY